MRPNNIMKLKEQKMSIEALKKGIKQILCLMLAYK